MTALLVKLFANKEIRRLHLDADSDGTVKYSNLVDKVTKLYPSIDNLKLTWQDQEGDMISITNDEELKEAFNVTKGQCVLRVYLNFTNEIYLNEKDVEENQDKINASAVRETNRSSFESKKPEMEPLIESEIKTSDPSLHTGVVCDECNGEVKGLRYKCLICHNYDLCNACMANSIHDHHNMICIQSPNDKAWIPSFISYRIPFFPPPHHSTHRYHHCHKRNENQQLSSNAEETQVAESAKKSESEKISLHTGITCDGCKGPVDGIRYKCLTCFNYDLCNTCQQKLVHPDHAMLCIVSPNDHTWRRAFVHRRFPAFIRRRFLGGMQPMLHPGCFRGGPTPRCQNQQEYGNTGQGAEISQKLQEQYSKQNVDIDEIGSIVANLINSVLLPIFEGPLVSAATKAVDIEIRKESENKNVQSESLADEPREKVKAFLINNNGSVEVMCHGCKCGPSSGTRFKCILCPDHDLCESCELKHMYLEHPTVCTTVSPRDQSCRRSFHHYHHHHHRPDRKCNLKVSENQAETTDAKHENKFAKNAQDQANQDDEAFLNGFVDLMKDSIEAFGKESRNNNEKTVAQTDELQNCDPKKQVNDNVDDDEIEQEEKIVEKSLENMLAMGFSNKNGWLRELLVQNNGDMFEVLDLFKPRRK